MPTISRVASIIGAALITMTVVASATAGPVKAVHYLDIKKASGDRVAALRAFMINSTRLILLRGNQVNVVYFNSNGSVSLGRSGFKKVQQGSWFVSDERKLSVCIKYNGQKRGVCYSADSSSAYWQAGACEGNKFKLPTRGNKAPAVIANARGRSSLVNACRGLSGKRHAKVRKLARIR